MDAKKRCIIFVLILSFFSISCHHADPINEKAMRIADLESRAIALRKNRFLLADKIRFTEDTLLNVNFKADSMRLKQNLVLFEKEKNGLLQSSLRLADTIHLALDSLRKYTFRNKEDKIRFNDKLNELLQKEK